MTKKKIVQDNRYWRKRSSTLAKKIVRHKADYICAYCGEGEPNRRTHGSHIFAEGVNKNMSADLDNILCICGVHHLAHASWNKANDWSWHGTPAESILWFKRKYPQRWERLKDRSNSHYKVNFEDRFKRLTVIAKEIGL